MTGFAEYDQYDGLGLAELIRHKDVTAFEVCEEAIRRIEEVNPKLNAVVTFMFEMARKQAEGPTPEGPFCGVPLLLKDVHHALKGVVMTSGSAALKNFVPDYDAEIVRRYKEAGVVILGKTNTPEFKLAYVTAPVLFGPTRNPWNPDYSPGGSSGGSAAAVAARMVPLASGTDEGGSIRVPASYCGLFGLKPSRGRNPVGPNFNDEWDGMSHSHVITRTVRDSAAMLDATSGPETGAPYGIPAPENSFLSELEREPGPLRIGFNTRSVYGVDIHPECIRAVDQAAMLLESLGHRVEEATPDYQEEEMAVNYIMVMIANLTASLEETTKSLQLSSLKGLIELPNASMARIGSSIRAPEMVRAKRKWREYGFTMAEFMQKYDFLLTPTLGRPPIKIGGEEPGTADRISMKVISSFLGRIILARNGLRNYILKELINNVMKIQVPLTMIANVTGQPAMSVPLYWTEEGLPCGVQFIGRWGNDASLLRLAAQLERAQPWIDKKPKIIA